MCRGLLNIDGSAINYLPKKEIMLLFPTISFAFSFECSVLPVHQASRVQDPNGVRAFKACIRCLAIVLLYYSLLMTHSLIYGEVILQPLIDSDPATYSRCSALFAVPIIELVSFMTDQQSGQGKLPIVFAILLVSCFTIQAILQLLYTFYESRTQMDIIVREVLYQETSQFVEGVKLKQKISLYGGEDAYFK